MDLAEKQKKNVAHFELIGDVYWLIVLAIYLGVSFLSHRWDITWIIWIIGGILSTPASMLFGKKRKIKIIDVSANKK